MFAKIFLLFAVLTAFTVQGLNANVNHSVLRNERGIIDDTIKDITNLLQAIKDFALTTVVGAIKAVKDVISTIRKLKDEYLTAGKDVIKGGIQGVKDYMKNCTAKATELGVNIDECLKGREAELSAIDSSLGGLISGCINDIVNKSLEMVKTDLDKIGEIQKDVVDLGVNITLSIPKCILTWKPLDCLSKIVDRLTAYIKKLPNDVTDIVNEALELAAYATNKCVTCVFNLEETTETQCSAIHDKIQKCVEIKFGSPTTPSAATDAPATDAPATDAPATEVPATEVPATDAPATEAPATNPNTDLSTDDAILVPTEESVVRASIADLLKQIQDLLVNLKSLVTGVIGETLETCTKLIATILSLKEDTLESGIRNITCTIGSLYDYIEQSAVDAVAVGVDITVCIFGRTDQLAALSIKLTENLTGCVLNVAEGGLQMTNDIVKICKVIVEDITTLALGMPGKITKCMLTWDKIECLQDLLSGISNQVIKIPIYVMDIINQAKLFVASLPEKFIECSANSGAEAIVQTSAIRGEIKTCVDEKMAAGKRIVNHRAYKARPIF